MERGIRYRLSGRSSRSRWSLALALGVGFAMSFALPAQATTATMDQSQTLTIGSEIWPWMAQTFTAGITGHLDHVSLPTYLARRSPPLPVHSLTRAFPTP